MTFIEVLVAQNMWLYLFDKLVIGINYYFVPLQPVIRMSLLEWRLSSWQKGFTIKPCLSCHTWVSDSNVTFFNITLCSSRSQREPGEVCVDWAGRMEGILLFLKSCRDVFAVGDALSSHNTNKYVKCQ